MTTTLLMLVLMSVLLFSVVVLTVLLVTTRRYRGELRRAFGKPSERGAEGAGARPEPERAVDEPERSPAPVQIRPLSPEHRERYLRAWDGAQRRFVDSPVVALSEADALVTQLLSERGFPTGGLPGQSEMLPVEHAPVLESYRAGRAIEQTNSSDRADIEQVRRGMLHFRTVFEALVGAASDATSGEPYAGQAPSAARPQQR